MSTYLELKAQAEALLAQAEAARKQELASVIQDIRAKIKEFGLSAADLGLTPSGTPNVAKKSAKSTSSAPAKYRGPNGELWAGGLGRKPQWVRDVVAKGENLEDYLIK